MLCSSGTNWPPLPRAQGAVSHPSEPVVYFTFVMDSIGQPICSSWQAHPNRPFFMKKKGSR